LPIFLLLEASLTAVDVEEVGLLVKGKAVDLAQVYSLPLELV